MGLTRHKIVILIPYFGTWPSWFGFFLQSCIYNASINWLFFTDCEIPEINNKHIRFVPFTLDDFNKLASRRTGTGVNIRHPYKLCDLKPAYGDIFAEYIADYDFWGYGDMDLIYGNFNHFFTDEMLENHDIFSNHETFISGHLCIIRNHPTTVSLYRKRDIYIDAFNDPYYTGFDEQRLHRRFNPDKLGLRSRMRSHLQRHIYRVNVNAALSPLVPSVIKSRRRKSHSANVRDFTSIVRHYADNEGIRVLYRRTFQSDLMLKKLSVKNWSIDWNRGNLRSSHEQEDILYFHFIHSKLFESFSPQGFSKDMEKFSITSAGISGGSR